MKSGSAESSSASRPPTNPSTPSTPSIAEGPIVGHYVEGAGETTTSTLTVPSSADRDSVKGKDGGKYKEEEKEKADNGSNLVGKITNLVSTDLNNIIEGRDFLMLVISLPLQITFCVAFLYKVLGWSAIVGIVVMTALYPLPGWIASKMQDIQTEKMKTVSRASPFTLWDPVSFRFSCRRTRAFRL